MKIILAIRKWSLNFYGRICFKIMNFNIEAFPITFHVECLFDAHCSVCFLFCLFIVLSVSCSVCVLFCLFLVLSVSCSVCFLFCLFLVLSVSCSICFLFCLFLVLSVSCSVCFLLCCFVRVLRSHLFMVPLNCSVCNTFFLNHLNWYLISFLVLCVKEMFKKLIVWSYILTCIYKIHH